MLGTHQTQFILFCCESPEGRLTEISRADDNGGRLLNWPLFAVSEI